MSTINVNLTPCACRYRDAAQRIDDHPYPCTVSPILIHCPIQSSITFQVALGECRYVSMCGHTCEGHHPDCTARPIRVTCSISGETWEESKAHGFQSRELAFVPDRVAAMFSDRWVLVKALVLGQWPTVSSIGTISEAIPALVTQRDAVFAALCEMAQEEDRRVAVKQQLFLACPAIFPKSGVSVPEAKKRESAAYLAAYITHLVEQVSTLEEA